jgi:hypothetical protein
MAKLAARNAWLALEANGASTILSPMTSSITLTFTTESTEVTGFGNDNRERVSDGIRDWELTMSGFWGSGASDPGTLLNTIRASGGSTRFKLAPATCIAGCPLYTACGVLSTYEITEAPGDAAAVSFTLVARSGSLTRTTIAAGV